MKLILKLVLGILIGLGVGYGYYAFEAGTTLSSVFEFGTRFLLTLESFLGQFIFFMIPLIILFFIASGISQIGGGSGKVVGATLGTAYMSTIIAGTLAYIVAILIIPSITDGGNIPEEGEGLEPFFTLEIPPVMDIMTALVLAFAFGIVLTLFKSDVMSKWFDEGKKVVEILIEKVVITILPFFIAGVFAGLGAEGTVIETISVFGLVLLLAIVMHWVWLTILYTIAGTLIGVNPFTLIGKILPAYFTAIGTMSSAATIPVTLKQVKTFGVRKNIAEFVIPLCATIHLSGSVITITTATIAVMSILPGYETPGLLSMVGTILLFGVVMVAAPGVPGGAIMAASGVLALNLGISNEALAFMIAIYMAQDSFGTATNISGDGAITVFIDWFDKKFNKNSTTELENSL